MKIKGFKRIAIANIKNINNYNMCNYVSIHIVVYIINLIGGYYETS